MKNINKLKPKTAVIFSEPNYGRITLIEGESKVRLITDKSEFDNDLFGLVTFVNEDGIQIEGYDRFVFWDYVFEIISE